MHRLSGSAVVARSGINLAQKLTRPKNDRVSVAVVGSLVALMAVTLSSAGEMPSLEMMWP